VLTIPNAISLARLLVILPGLWVLAIKEHTVWVGILILVALLSDILDGYLARKWNQDSDLGARLDSLADNTLIPCTIVWLAMLRPELLDPPNLIKISAATGIYLTMLTVGLVRFRRFAGLHLYTGKAVGAVGTLFLFNTFVFGFHPVVFDVALGVFTLANLEALIIFATFLEVDEHIGSILRWHTWSDSRARRAG
jgi:CDP-diacylglycerol--glycerol-3-phosphate 3-phosphatidyltransferase